MVARQAKEKKSQIGRWKGLDEDVSDDQVSLQSMSVFSVKPRLLVSCNTSSLEAVGKKTLSGSSTSISRESVHLLPCRSAARTYDVPLFILYPP